MARAPAPTVDDFLRLRDRCLDDLAAAGLLGVQEIHERRRKAYFDLLERVPMRLRRGLQDQVMWACFGIRPPRLPLPLRRIQRAVDERLCLDAVYFSAYTRTTRRRILRPHRILCAPLADYLFARDPEKPELTTYRVDRLQEFTVTEQHFHREPHLEWEDYIRPDLFARQELAFNLRMRFRGRSAAEVKRNKARFKGARLNRDGSVTHVFRAASDAYYIHLALSVWRWDAEVLAPEASAEAFRRAVAALPEPPPAEFRRWSLILRGAAPRR
ncbi:MAG TPA: WYL domain-containing protein [Candidatus Saccharimonadales bacterium]|nr:WYL domain-containing protein [Candidatus Saccharimonadales bacterium]